MICDVHAHCIPSELVSWIHRHGPDVGVTTDTNGDKTSVIFDGRYRTAPLRADLTEHQRRIDVMDRTGVDVQVLASWIDLTGYQLSAAGGRDWSKAINESLLGEAAMDPDRFRVLCTAPLQDPTAAAEELALRMQDPAVVGIEIATRVDQAPLGDASLDEFWSAAEETDAMVLVHPMDPIPSIDLSGHFMHNMLGRPVESTLAFGSMLFAGVLERHPRLTLCLVHGGGFVPFQIGRMDQGFREKPRLVGEHISMEPGEYLRRNVFLDTVVHDPTVLRFMVDLVGSERILLGTDYPFEMGDQDPVRFVNSAGLAAEDAVRILSGNASTLFGLPGGDAS